MGKGIWSRDLPSLLRILQDLQRSDGAAGDGPYMDTEITRQLFTRVIDAAQILGIDGAFRAKVKAAGDRLPAFQIGKFGQLQEWMEDYEEPQPGHRHISQLFALHPGNQITPRGTPELAKAARATLERRLANGGGHTGWSRAWIINFWARLEDGEKAGENVTALLAKSTQPNMLDTHPPFQIDGNFGGTAGIAEMLLQSHAGEISILPALPKAWSKGAVTGLHARGAVEVDIEWENGKATRVALRSAVAGEHKIRFADGRVETVKLASGQGTRARREIMKGCHRPRILASDAEYSHWPFGRPIDWSRHASASYVDHI